MRRVLIISPHFPPVNAPDMQRVRMCLGYFKQYGWQPTVVCVDEHFVNGFKDELLSATIPGDIEVLKVSAYPEKFTRKLGLGSVSLRSLVQFKNAGNQLLKREKYDLVFFSTSLHHVCVLGRYWKKKFGVPFIIDMQDPWRNDFRIGKTKQVSSFKFWIAYNINKYMEAYTMPYVDGIISVSDAYIHTLKKRYKDLIKIPAKTITFGAAQTDFDIVESKKITLEFINTTNNKVNVVYIGAITPFFIPVIRLFFESLLDHHDRVDRYHFYFLGTSYAKGSKVTMVADLAQELEIKEHVTEIAERVPYFKALATLKAADILFIPGSLDKDYNASKVYNNILARKPIFSIFHKDSSIIPVIEKTGSGVVYSFEHFNSPLKMKEEIYNKWIELQQNLHSYAKGNTIFDFSANKKTEEITSFFNEVLQMSNNVHV